MPDIYQQGIMLPGPLAAQLPKTQFGISQLWFVNRTPLASRLPKAPVGNVSFQMVGYRFRPRALTLTATVLIGDTTINVNDASILMNGDVIQFGATGEAAEVIAAPNIGANTVSIRRGVGTAQGTFTPVAATAIASIAGSLANFSIIGNSRTGGEINQLAISQTPTSVTQYVQTFQHVVQVAGVMQDIQGFPWPGNNPAPWPKNKLDAMQNFMDDVEFTSLYGIGEALGGSNSRPKQYGLTNLIQTHNVSASNPSAYKPSDFLSDILGPIQDSGGRASIILASNSFRSGLATWGTHLQYTTAGQTAFGVDIDVLYNPFIGPVPIVYDMWLKPGTALALTGEEVRFRVMHDPDYQPYGRRGDTGTADNNGEGDWIGRMAIELDNEAHHGYVSGITAFAPPT